MSLSLYILAAYKKESSLATEAGLKYVILGSFSSGLFLFGTSLVYGFTGTINFNELLSYLDSSKSNLSLLAISGYKSLYYLENIISNTDNLGLVSKEVVVSAGHIFKKKKYFSHRGRV